MTQLAVQSQFLFAMLRSLLRREEGQGSVEYAVVVAVVIIAVAGMSVFMQGQIQAAITAAFGQITAAIATL